jgi:hypothetical protein
MPGFQVRLVFVALAMWGQGDVSVEAGGDWGGEDVPQVEWDDVGGDEIDLVLVVGWWLILQFGCAPDARIIASQSARGFARAPGCFGDDKAVASG